MNILLLGAGGFIGVNLTERLLADGEHSVTAVDISDEKLEHLLDTRSLNYLHLDISNDEDKIGALVKESDVVVDLVAFANPALYVEDPVGVYDLNFTQNLKVVDQCRKHDKRLIQFSTCEVYGITAAKAFGLSSKDNPCPFSEDESPLIMGPIKNHRWIYASAKQLLERVLHAYGHRDGFRYSIIRPFNFVGPRIDYLPSEAGGGNPRVFSHFMDALLYGNHPIRLVEGGMNYRAYTYIDDAVDCIVKIIEDKKNNCNGEIFNIGQPENELTIAELATKMRDMFDEHFREEGDPPRPEIVNVTAEEFYGEGYEDCDRRIADVSKAKRLLDWDAKHSVDEVIYKTMEYFVNQHRKKQRSSREEGTVLA